MKGWLFSARLSCRDNTGCAVGLDRGQREPLPSMGDAMHSRSNMRQNFLLLSAAMGATLLGGAGASANVIYTVDQIIGGGSVTGTMTTNGAIGALLPADFLSWNLELNGVRASFNLTRETVSSSNKAPTSTRPHLRSLSTSAGVTTDYSLFRMGYFREHTIGAVRLRATSVFKERPSRQSSTAISAPRTSALAVARLS